MKRKFLVLGGFIVLICVTGCVDALQRNKDVVRRSNEEIWSRGNLKLVDELYTEDFVCHFLIGPEWQGREGLIEQVTAHRKSFPDWKEKVLRLVAEDDFVVVHFSSSGTNTGEFEGNAPTGKRVRIHEIAIFRMEDGKIAEQWGFPDIQGLSQQLGIAGPSTNMPDE